MGLMLFFMGLFASYLLLANQYAKRVEESVDLKVFIHDGADPALVEEMGQMLEKAAFARSVAFRSKAEAAEMYAEQFSDDFTAPLNGINPLPASFQVKLWPPYIQPDSVGRIRSQLMDQVIVEGVDYPLEQMLKLQANFRTISWITLGLGLVLLGVALYLISATIRLSVFAQRLAIRSMQLIGATDGFIRRPFLQKGLIQGAAAGLGGGFLVIAAWWILAWLSPEPLPLWHLTSPAFIGLLGGIVLLGLLLGWAGSFLAVNRYLHKNLDQLMQQ